MNIHMIGIAGVGMSALAQLLHHQGHRVTGSDSAEFPTLNAVRALGIPVAIGYDARNIPADAERVVYTDAAHEDNVERVAAKERGLEDLSYFEVLGEVSKEKRTIVVAGTHGKTTTTGMLAKILIDAGKSPTVVVGSLMKDFGGNFVAGTSDVFVVEGCEYRDHLLELFPDILVITNVEWDHTDWFKTEAAMRATFDKARAKAKRVVDSSMYKSEPAYELQLIGDFNKDNARAAAAAARAAFPDISDEQIRESLKSFQGSWRRFEYKGKTKNGVPVYDDYAHHPTAIRETISAVREKFGNKKIIVAFHPHLYSRTRDLMGDFARAFDVADKVYLAPIYGARETPMAGASSEVLEAKINMLKSGHAESLPTLDAIESVLASVTDQDSIIITMGAGDIYKVADRLVL